MRILLAIPLLLAVVAVADAGCRVVKQVVVKQVVAQPVIYYPAYGGYSAASYNGGNGNGIVVPVPVLEKLIATLENLESKLSEPAGGHTAESVLATNCAKCHQDGNNPKAGFVLFNADGTPAELSLGDKRLIRRAVTTTDPAQRMPPSKPLSSGAAQALLQGLK